MAERLSHLNSIYCMVGFRFLLHLLHVHSCLFIDIDLYIQFNRRILN